MSASVSVVGNLTRDPETRETPKNSVTKLNIAVNWKDGNEEGVDFYVASVWGNYGKATERLFSKGDPIHVYGELLHRPYEAKTGEAKESKEIKDAKWGLAGPRSGGGGRREQPSDSDDGEYPF